MSKSTDEAIQSAAKGFAIIPTDPEEVRNAKIKDSMLNRDDWEEFNNRLCAELKIRGCTILQGQLNPFWVDNKTFRDLIDYVDQRCGF
jgi:hypothetical protein